MEDGDWKPSLVPGACLCGAIRFEVELPAFHCMHCHCTICRRAHGAAYTTWFTVPRERFRMVKGEALLSEHRSSDFASRYFCSQCGSSLLFMSDDEPGDMDIVLANMEGSISQTPERHSYFDHAAPWIEVNDTLPRLGGDDGQQPL